MGGPAAGAARGTTAAWPLLVALTLSFWPSVASGQSWKPGAATPEWVGRSARFEVHRRKPWLVASGNSDPHPREPRATISKAEGEARDRLRVAIGRVVSMWLADLLTTASLETGEGLATRAAWARRVERSLQPAMLHDMRMVTAQRHADGRYSSLYGWRLDKLAPAYARAVLEGLAEGCPPRAEVQRALATQTARLAQLDVEALNELVGLALPEPAWVRRSDGVFAADEGVFLEAMGTGRDDSSEQALQAAYLAGRAQLLALVQRLLGQSSRELAARFDDLGGLGPALTARLTDELPAMVGQRLIADSDAAQFEGFDGTLHVLMRIRLDALWGTYETQVSEVLKDLRPAAERLAVHMEACRGQSVEQLDAMSRAGG